MRARWALLQRWRSRRLRRRDVGRRSSRGWASSATRLPRSSTARWWPTTSWGVDVADRAGAHEAGRAGQVPLARCAHAGVRAPTTPLPRSTRFEIAARAGTCALDGFGLAKDVTGRSRPSGCACDRGIAGDVGHARSAHRVGFNQPVRRRDVEKRCAYVSDAQARRRGRRQHRRERRRRATASGVAARAAGPWHQWRFECGAELTGAEGPLRAEVERATRSPAERSPSRPTGRSR